jgi:hypothetical protein
VKSIPASEPAAGQQATRSQLSVTAGGDDRGHALGLGQAHLPVEKRPGRELAGLGPPNLEVPGPPRLDQPVDHALHEHRVARKLKLHRVLARVGARRGEHEREAGQFKVVQVKPGVMGTTAGARFAQPQAPFEQLKGARAADAHDPAQRCPRRARNSQDRGARVDHGMKDGRLAELADLLSLLTC